MGLAIAKAVDSRINRRKTGGVEVTAPASSATAARRDAVQTGALVRQVSAPRPTSGAERSQRASRGASGDGAHFRWFRFIEPLERGLRGTARTPDRQKSNT